MDKENNPLVTARKPHGSVPRGSLPLGDNYPRGDCHHDMLFQALSAQDRNFLFAMTQNESVTGFGSIRERLGVSPGYASKYRERLLVAGMVKAVAHGKLAFAPPYMREYLLAKQ